MPARRHMREWTPADNRKLREYAKKRISARIAAQKLGRSAGATRYKAMMLGIQFRSTNRAIRPRRRG